VPSTGPKLSDTPSDLALCPATLVAVRGIISIAGYVPYRRLARQEISSFLGSGGGKGVRSVASHDEDTTTLGFEAARLALRAVAATRDAAPGPAAGPTPSALWFATANPAYLDKTNATAIHRALRLPRDTAAFDFGGALRSGIGALSAAFEGSGSVLVVAADRRDGLPTSSDEAAGGDAGAAALVGDGTDQPLLAEHLVTASITDELADRWRTPEDRRSRVWEERFGENRYLALGVEAWNRALAAVGIAAGHISRVIVTGMHERAVKGLPARLGVAAGAVADDLTSTVGQTGSAHPLLVLAALLETEAGGTRGWPGTEAGSVIALVHLADGADVTLLRTTAGLATWHPPRPVTTQVRNGAPISYGKYLSWRGMLDIEPPRRPEPQRVSSPAAWRSEDWKYGFVGSKDRTTGAVHLPPSRISMDGGAFDDMEPIAMAGAMGTVVTSTVDRMVYSPSPPVVFAVVDFDGGGRFPVEVTDVDADGLAAGDRVEMTFRRLFTADGIHNYFWKARPVRSELRPAAPNEAETHGEAEGSTTEPTGGRRS